MNKKRILSFIFAIVFLFGLVRIPKVNVEAASEQGNIEFTSHSNWDYISCLKSTKIKWKSVSGAVGYCFTAVKGGLSGSGGTFVPSEDICRNVWTTSTSYTIPATETPCYIKIHVSAMIEKTTSDWSKQIDYGEIYLLHAAESPSISVGSASNITTNSVSLNMTISKNYGLDISDSGFYIGTSSSNMTKYSFKKYSTSQNYATSTSKTMQITGLKAGTTYYYSAYAVNDYGESETSTKTFTTISSSSGNISLSSSTASLNWGIDNEDDVTVTCGGTCSVSDVEYDVPSSVVNDGRYKYEWLKVTKSGNNINFRTVMKNYSASARKAYVDVSYGGQTKTITITQKACGESAPTMNLYREAGNPYSNGDFIGSFAFPQDCMDIYVSSTNVRKISAQLRDGEGVSGLIEVVNEEDLINESDIHKNGIIGSISSGTLRFDMSGLAVGDYFIRIYTSNSNVDNDYYKRSAYSNEPFELHFSVVGSGSGNYDDSDFQKLESSFSSYTSGKLLNSSVSNYMLKAIKHHISERDIIDKLSKGECVVFFFDGCSSHLEGATACKYGYRVKKPGENALKDNQWYTDSAVCLVVKNVGGYPVVTFATNTAITTPDNVRRTVDSDNMLVVDGKYSIVAFSHHGSSNDTNDKNYAALQIRDYNNSSLGASDCIIRSQIDANGNNIKTFKISSKTTDVGADIHAHKNYWCSAAYADSGGCLLVGTSIPKSYEEYMNFIHETTGFSEIPVKSIGGSSYYNNQYDKTLEGKRVGTVIIDRTCYLKNLPVIYGDDTKSGGIEETQVATGKNIASTITADSIEWREAIMGSGDPIVKLWDEYSVTSIHTNPGAGTEIEINLQSISVSSNPSKTSYYIGDTFNSSGLKIKATYSDGSTETISADNSGVNVSTPVMTSAGTKTVTVTYGGKSTTFTITVNTPSISLSSTSKTMTVGDTATITATTTPSGQSVIWSTSNTSVATVSSGKITAKAAGTATITAKFTYNGTTYSKTCSVTVNAAPKTLQSISVSNNPSKTSYYIGDTFNSSGLKIKATYSDGSTETISSGFTVSTPVMTSAGTKTVTVTYGGKSTTFNITVNTPSISLSSTSKTMTVGDTATLTATTAPSGQSVTWSSSNTSVATVSSGKITAKAAGNATITAKVTYNGTTYSKTCSVTVNAAPKTLQSISVSSNPSKTSYYIGDTFSSSGLKIKATYSDNSTETISSGFTVSTPSMTSAGTKTVTVTYGGKGTTFNITVYTPSISLSSTSKTMTVGNASTLTATTTPSGQSVTWSSSNTSVATVSNGTITAKTAGTATITAKFTYNGTTYSKTCSVTVNPAICAITFNANGGIVSPTSKTVTLPYVFDVVPTRSGYTFLGWSTSNSATSPTYRTGDSYNSTSNITLYAVWQANPTVMLGDVNNDGEIDAADAGIIARYDAGFITLTVQQLAAGDVNHDGEVDAADAGLIARYDAGFIAILQ